MHEKTKIYVVESSGRYLHGSSPDCFYLSREEAEFAVYKLNQDQRNQMCGEYSFGMIRYYSVSEIPAGQVYPRDKTYDKYLKGKIADIEASLKKEKECMESDKTEIANLEEQLKGLILALAEKR